MPTFRPDALQRRTIPLSLILGLEDVVRVQDPSIQQTGGEDPKWYIRPWVDCFDENGLPGRRQQRIYLGRMAEMKKREALNRKRDIMAVINKSQYVLQSQVRFGDFLDQYEKEYVRKPENLSASTQAKYLCHLKNHIRPAFEEMQMAAVNTQAIDAFLKAKVKAGLSWNTRTDLRNLLCGIFTQAERWGFWKEKNPAMAATVGRKRTARPQRKLTIEETKALLRALPADVRLICEVSLYCTLRISETLGLMWKHINFATGKIEIRQRFYRGDIDIVKSERSQRDVPMGDLAEDLRAMYPGKGHAEEFVFSVRTHVSREKKPRTCRDDRDINQHFLRPAARELKAYWLGFGFHAFRREAVTEIAREAGSNQAQRMAGHSKADMTTHYTLTDDLAQAKAVRALQRRVRGAKVIKIKKTA